MPPRTNETAGIARRATRSRGQLPPGPSPGETFDLNVSGSSDDSAAHATLEYTPAGPAGPATPDLSSLNVNSPDVAPANTEPTTPLGINDPDLPPRGKNHAPNIRYFFEVSPYEKVCKVCRDLRATMGDAFPVDRKYIFSGKTSNTSLRPHLEKYHCSPYMQMKALHGWPTNLPGQASQMTTGATPAQVIRPTDVFSEQTFHRHLINFIVADDQSLNVLECPEFRTLLLLLRSDLKETMIPHRTKIRELIIQAWRRHFQNLRQDLASAVGRVSFTADIWSDQNRRSFLAVTAHWIANVDETASLRHKTALIAFHRLRGGHSGKAVAEVIMGLLDRAGVTVKAGHFTLDNASMNYTMMQELETMFRERDIDFAAGERQIMCFAHVVNLSSGGVIKGVTDTVSPDGDDDDLGVDHLPARLPPNAPESQSYDDAVARDPIALGRNVVRAIRGSGKRREDFDEVIDNGNAKDWFAGDSKKKAIQVPHKQLLRDVSTRWDSVYHMINRLREMRPAIDYFLALPNHRDLAKYRISPQEWGVMQDLEVILGVPHRVQHLMSSESIPVLSGAIPAFEMFMTRWERLKKEKPHLAPFINKGLDSAYKYYDRMDRTQGYIIAMLINPAIRLSWIRKQWDSDYVASAERKIREAMIEYRATTATEEQQQQPPPTGTLTPHIGEIPHYMSLDVQYGIEEDDMAIGGSSSDQTVEQEFQAYITAPLSPPSIDILKFWEVNRTTFPTLFAMAMDYLPIQATAVPCERIFSSSSETTTKKRNRISPLLMESLQMLKFHLKKERLNFTAGWITSEKQMSDDDRNEDLLSNLLDAVDGDYQDALDTAIRSVNDDD